MKKTATPHINFTLCGYISRVIRKITQGRKKAKKRRSGIITGAIVLTIVNISTKSQQLRVALSRLHNNTLFEWATVSIILLSSVSIGAKSYNLPGLLHNLVIALDWFISVYFLVELTLRLLVAGGFRAFFRRGWNIFDFIIVTVSLIPINESEYALLARLLRLFRVMRLIYIVPQLRVLIAALIKAIPRIGYVALMMFIIFYMYAAAGNLMFEDINPTLWGNVGIAMLTLFRIATFEDWTDVMYETMEVYPLSWMFYLSFIFLSAFVFLNMMIGVIIESLSEEHSIDSQLSSLPLQLTHIESRLTGIEEKLDSLAAANSRQPRPPSV